MKSLLASLVGLALLLPSAARAQSENDPGYDGLQPEYAPPPPGPAGELDELPAEEQPASEVDYQTFHDALSQYGNWVYTTDYGWVWSPAGVDQDWRPYSDGQWLWTSYGWTWSGYEPWAWAPYHYGRWCYLNNIGWGWVPGFTWGPAWVSWRVGGDFVGWTPLYPGYPYGGPWLGTYPIYYGQWCFTGYGTFWGGPVYGNLYPTPYVQSNVWGHTHAVVPAQSGGVVYNGPSHSAVAAAVGHPITPVAIHPVAAASQAGFHAGASAMNVYAPRFQAAAHPFATRHGGVSASVSAQQPRGVGSLVRQGAVTPTAQARVARAPMAPAPIGAHPASAPAGVQPNRGNVPTTPTATPRGTPGGGGGTHPAGHPAPQAQRSAPATGTFSTYHANPSYAPSGESSYSASTSDDRGAAGSYASNYGGNAHASPGYGGGYGNYRGVQQSNSSHATPQPSYGNGSGSHPNNGGGAGASHASYGGGAGASHPNYGGGASSHPTSSQGGAPHTNSAGGSASQPSIGGAASVHPNASGGARFSSAASQGGGRH